MGNPSPASSPDGLHAASARCPPSFLDAGCALADIAGAANLLKQGNSLEIRRPPFICTEESHPMPTNAPLNRKLRMALIGGGQGAFIGRVHCTAAVLDNRAALVAGALSSTAEKS